MVEVNLSCPHVPSLPPLAVRALGPDPHRNFLALIGLFGSPFCEILHTPLPYTSFSCWSLAIHLSPDAFISFGPSLLTAHQQDHGKYWNLYSPCLSTLSDSMLVLSLMCLYLSSLQASCHLSQALFRIGALFVWFQPNGIPLPFHCSTMAIKILSFLDIRQTCPCYLDGHSTQNLWWFLYVFTLPPSGGCCLDSTFGLHSSLYLSWCHTGAWTIIGH